MIAEYIYQCVDEAVRISGGGGVAIADFGLRCAPSNRLTHGDSKAPAGTAVLYGARSERHSIQGISIDTTQHGLASRRLSGQHHKGILGLT